MHLKMNKEKKKKRKSKKRLLNDYVTLFKQFYK